MSTPDLSLAPIAVFCYNRLFHLQTTINSLKENYFAEQSSIYFFSDGWKNDEDKRSVEEVREYLHSISGFKNITIIESESNQGLAKSVIEGVTEVINHYGKIIVVEDDLYLSPYFLTFMNNALCAYENYDQIGCVNAHSSISFNDEQIYYINHADSWGWGTWKRAWDFFNDNGKQLLKYINNNNQNKCFDFNGAYPYTRMLYHQTIGKNNSWAIRWKASLYVNNKLSVNAGKSMVDNIGCDGSGTHCAINFFPTQFYNGPIDIPPIRTIEETEKARRRLRNYYLFYNSKIIKGIMMTKAYFNRFIIGLLKYIHPSKLNS